jgi:hypothetical protein
LLAIAEEVSEEGVLEEGAEEGVPVHGRDLGRGDVDYSGKSSFRREDDGVTGQG